MGKYIIKLDNKELFFEDYDEVIYFLHNIYSKEISISDIDLILYEEIENERKILLRFNKFSIGDKVYSIKSKYIKKLCMDCLGRGIVNENETCEACNGLGNYEIDSLKYEVSTFPLEIIEINKKIGEDEFCILEGDNKKLFKIPIIDLFYSKEEAIDFCISYNQIVDAKPKYEML
jgi:hypothetical protein